MTKLLEKAIAKARALPAEDQDVLGAVMLAFAEEELARIGELDDETRAAIREGLEQARRGEFFPRSRSRLSGDASVYESPPTSRARDDIEAILVYIGDRNPQGARSVRRALDATINLIESYPESGRLAVRTECACFLPGNTPI
jgi:hypothetical protein